MHAAIFVIDHHAAVREALGEMLSVFGYAVKTYESADGFLQELDQRNVGCVVADVRMPGTDGLGCPIDFSLRACAAIVLDCVHLPHNGRPSVAAYSAVSAMLRRRTKWLRNVGVTRELYNRRLCQGRGVGRTSVCQAFGSRPMTLINYELQAGTSIPGCQGPTSAQARMVPGRSSAKSDRIGRDPIGPYHSGCARPLPS